MRIPVRRDVSRSVCGGGADWPKALLRNVPLASLWRFVYDLRNGCGRDLALLTLERPSGLFQPYSTTAENRYPLLFQFVRDRLGDGRERSILSFGCSTGEEVFSLRHYFPFARIKGIDINRRNIQKSRARLAQRGGDPLLSFETAGGAAAEPREHYDAVFAMAVLRHGGLGNAPPRCEHLLRFADFNRCVGELADILKPGGLLVLRHTNFRFTDSAAAASFQRIFSPPPARLPGVATPLYGTDNRLMPGAQPDDGVFEKNRMISRTNQDI